MAQWLPLYQLSVEDVRLVVRTFTHSFEHAYAFLAAADLILIGTHEPLRIDEDALRRRLASPAGERLAPYGLRAPGRLLGLLVHGPRGLRAFARDGALNTDDHLSLEFSAGRHAYTDESGRALDLLLIGRRAPSTLLTGRRTETFAEELGNADLFRRATRRWLSDDAAGALRLLDAMHAADPDNAYARTLLLDTRVTLARQALHANRLEDARTAVQTLLGEKDVPPNLLIDALEILREACLLYTSPSPRDL